MDQDARRFPVSTFETVVPASGGGDGDLVRPCTPVVRARTANDAAGRVYRAQRAPLRLASEHPFWSARNDSRFPMKPIAFIGLLLLAGTARTAAAQDRGRVALVIGLPAALGVVVDVTPRLAIRPELTFSTNTFDNPIEGGFGSEQWSVGIGAAGLIYFTSRDGLRTYVSPRFLYTHSGATVGTLVNSVGTTSSGWSYTTSGSYGAEYTLGRRFGVFGEIGLQYSRIRILFVPGGTATLRSHGWNTRTAVGVLLR